MAYTVFQHDTRVGLRTDLEGPFHYPSGAVLYYDLRAGEYYDPRTDFYVDRTNSVVKIQHYILLDTKMQFCYNTHINKNFNPNLRNTAHVRYSYNNFSSSSS